MSGWMIWGGAALLYGAFRGWYDGFRRRPLTPAEIDAYMLRVEAEALQVGSDFDELRRFLEEDDGQEFVMLNLVKLHPEPVPHPETGEPMKARDLVKGYISDFLPSLLKRGGVPLMQARKVGPYIDAWGTEADPGWTLVGCMRYRSRRDMVSLVADPRFLESHAFKIAALTHTFSFPTQVGGGGD